MQPAAMAQGPAKPGDILNYQGQDREQRLIEQAKQEGTLALYTSLAPTESKPLAAAFEKKYGVKVEETFFSTTDEAMAADRDAYARFFGAMLDEGVLLPPSQFEAWFISLAHDREFIDETVAAARKAFRA